MTGGLLSALLFGVTSVVARRAIRLVGFVRANAWRLALAFVVLGVASFALGRGSGEQAGALALAGAVGFGVGGVALYRALPLLGAPLASLVVETVAAIVAVSVAWAWYGDSVGLEMLVACAVILAGVVVGLAPFVRHGGWPARLGLGMTTAVVAAAAQGFGLVLTRKALLDMRAADAAGTAPDGSAADGSVEHVVAASFDRVAGGLAVALLVWLGVRVAARWLPAAQEALGAAGGFAPGGDGDRTDFGVIGSRLPDRPWFWVGANAVVGPVLGVTCLVWALTTLQPGVAQAVTAAAALISVPVAHWLEGHEQPASFWVGASVSAAGFVGLFLAFD